MSLVTGHLGIGSDCYKRGNKPQSWVVQVGGAGRRTKLLPGQASRDHLQLPLAAPLGQEWRAGPRCHLGVLQSCSQPLRKPIYLQVHLRSLGGREAGSEGHGLPQPRPGPRHSGQGGGGQGPSPPHCGERLGVDSAGQACCMWPGMATLEPVSPQYSGDESGSGSPPNRRARTLHNTPPGEDCSTAGVGAGGGLWGFGIQRGWQSCFHPSSIPVLPSLVGSAL